jgi:hypothetical protein
MEICFGTPNFNQMLTKIWSTVREGLGTLYYFRRHKYAIKYFGAKLAIFILYLSVKCNSTDLHCCVSIATMVTRTRQNITL